MNAEKDAAIAFGDNVGALVPIIAPKIRPPLVGIMNEERGEIVATAVTFEAGTDEGVTVGHIYVCTPPDEVGRIIASAQDERRSLVAWVIRMHDSHPSGRRWLKGYLEPLRVD